MFNGGNVDDIVEQLSDERTGVDEPYVGAHTDATGDDMAEPAAHTIGWDNNEFLGKWIGRDIDEPVDQPIGKGVQPHVDMKFTSHGSHSTHQVCQRGPRRRV